jgi:hypothetical protein
MQGHDAHGVTSGGAADSAIFAVMLTIRRVLISA